MRSRFRKRSSTRGGDELVDRFFSSDEHGAASPVAQRKLKQLCREVERVLAHLLPDGTEDPVLAGVYVVEVLPAPDASRLAVCVRGPADDAARPARVIVEHLERSKGWLRAEIAAAIQRKRTPDLCFEVLP